MSVASTPRPKTGSAGGAKLRIYLVRSTSGPAVVLVSLLLHLAAGGILWRAGRAAASPRPVPTAEPSATAAMVGESFDVPPETAPGDPIPAPDLEPPGAPPPAPSAPTTSAPTPTATASTTATASSRPSPPSSPSASASSSVSSPAPPALYGAVGVRYAVDLLKTFTQSLPQAASADPQWGAIALGAAGDADLTLEIDEAGELRHDVEIRGAPSAALKSGILRAIGLIGGRSFTARAARTHLRIAAVVSADTHEDEYHGSRFALTGTGSCNGYVCTAFFALPIGRRIDFTLRLVP